MNTYRVIFEDPNDLDAPAQVLVPSQRWMEQAMAGNLPPIWVLWQLQDDEQQAIAEGRHDTFSHDPEKHALQWTAPPHWTLNGRGSYGIFMYERFATQGLGRRTQQTNV